VLGAVAADGAVDQGEATGPGVDAASELGGVVADHAGVQADVGVKAGHGAADIVRVPVAQGQGGEADPDLAAEVEQPVQLPTVDDGEAGPGPLDDEGVGHVEVAGGVLVLVRPGQGDL